MVVLESLAGTDVYGRLICLHLRMEMFCLQYQIQCAVSEEAVSGRLKGSMNQSRDMCLLCGLLDAIKSPHPSNTF